MSHNFRCRCGLVTMTTVSRARSLSTATTQGSEVEVHESSAKVSKVKRRLAREIVIRQVNWWWVESEWVWLGVLLLEMCLQEAREYVNAEHSDFTVFFSSSTSPLSICW